MYKLADFAKKFWQSEVKQLEELFTATIPLPDFPAASEDEYGRALRSLQQLDAAKRARLAVIRELERIIEDAAPKRNRALRGHEVPIMTEQQEQLLKLVRKRLNATAEAPTQSE